MITEALSLDSDNSVWTMWALRCITAFTTLPAAYEAWKINKLVRNRYLTGILRKIVIGLVILTLARILSANLDDFLQLRVPLSGFIVTSAFWLWVSYYFHKHRIAIETESYGTVGRERLSKKIDDIIIELEMAHKERRVSRTTGERTIKQP